MGLDRAEVERSLAEILARVPDVPMRLVGTASSLLRGIDLPAHDIDILFKNRGSVDQWFEALSGGVEVDTPPAWIGDARQYFGRVLVGGVTVELSTVEVGADTDTAECVGAGPWKYFDLVPCGDRTVPAVASDLNSAGSGTG